MNAAATEEAEAKAKASQTLPKKKLKTAVAAAAAAAAVAAVSAAVSAATTTTTELKPERLLASVVEPRLYPASCGTARGMVVLLLDPKKEVMVRV